MEDVDLETVSFYILLASWSLLHLRVGFLKPLLVGSKRHKLGLVQRVGALTYHLMLRKSKKIEVFHITTSLLYLMVFINILLSFPFSVGVSFLCD